METNLNIEEKDIGFIKEYLKGKDKPVPLSEISNSLAYFKTEKNRVKKVKIYNPNCEYKVGDLIYKKYPGKLPVGAKKHLVLTDGVVLKVVEVRSRFKNEVKLTYEGTSDYKKYIDYLKRQKIELLLPHKQKKPCEKAEYIKDEDDPRKKYSPLLKKDFNILNKKLVSVLTKRNDIAFTADKVMLVENLKPVEQDVFVKIKDFLKENGKSESTEFFVENFLKISPEDENFESYCFSLNYRMHADHKIDFQQVDKNGWGKWNLISLIYYLKKDSIISEMNPLASKYDIENKKGLSQRRKKFIEDIFDGNPNRYFISQREISAGALRLRSALPDKTEFEEITLVDESTKKKYIGYYYADSKLLLGMDEIYKSYKIIQGAILTVSEFSENTIHFNIRVTKKGTISTRIEYDKERKTFVPKEEKIASQVFTNKSMYLDPGIISEVNLNVDYYRNSETLNDLILKIFLNFGIKEKNSELHILQLYHILDLLYPINLKTVVDIILGNSLFIPSEKVSGVFYLDISVTEREQFSTIKESNETEDSGTGSLDTEKGSSELSARDEIKRLREERKRKREEEMMRKEQLERERERVKERKSRKYDEVISDKVEKMEATPVDDRKAVFEKSRKKAATVKKSSKETFKEKESKPSKKSVVKPEDDQLDIEDIKSEIELLELKEKVEKGKRGTVKKKKKEIAFKDDGKGLGGLLASKLDDIVKAEKPKKKDNEKK